MNSNLNSYKEPLKEARDDLKGKNFREAAERAGGRFEGDYILLPYLVHTLKIDVYTLEVSFLDSSRRVDPRLEILTTALLKRCKRHRTFWRNYQF